MLGPLRSVNTIARFECSTSMESRRNLFLCLLYMKKASERQIKFTVMRKARFKNFRKYEAVYATMLYRSEND